LCWFWASSQWDGSWVSKFPSRGVSIFVADKCRQSAGNIYYCRVFCSWIQESKGINYFMQV
jgi:hypothetical protein